MARPSQIEDKRAELLPLVARAFAELGYRRTTTAELAARCRVQENILYRIWPDKKTMFIAAIDYIYELSKKTWERVMTESPLDSAALRLLEYEAKHLGEFGHARIIFAGLSETDDPDIRRAMAQMYQQYQELIARQVQTHRKDHKSNGQLDADLTAWAIIGMGTVATIGRELKILNGRNRGRLVKEIGQCLLDQHTEP